MSFAKIDWSVEKTKLLFRDPPMPRLSEIRRRQVSLTSMSYDGAVIAESFATKSGDMFDLDIEFFGEAADVSFLRRSILRVSLLKLEQQKALKVRVRSIPSEELELFGFLPSDLGHTLEIAPVAASLRTELKSQLKDYIRAAPKVGRGYLIDAERLNEHAVEELNCEYGEVAWGLTNWARHSSIASDEAQLIAQLPHSKHALEVGAGSGRVTGELMSRCDRITTTDILQETFPHLAKLGSAVHPMLDDISSSLLPSDTFDLVTFWENGLGAVFGAKKRARAFEHMSRVCKPGGLIVVAVRQLLPISVDQLMVAAQSEDVMGVYHTFSDEEMRALQTGNTILESVVVGDDRPAGGFQKFFLFRKA